MDQALTVDVVPHIPMLKRYALKLARNLPDADDLVQDCLLRALSRAHQFEPGTNLSAWLTTILRNLFINRYQHGRRVVEVELEPDIVEISMEAPQVYHVELRDAEMAIQDLKPEQRQLIHKCGVEGVSYEDAANEMGVSVGTIRSRLSRARSRLREKVAGRIRPAYLNSRVMNSGVMSGRVGQKRHQAPDRHDLDREERDIEAPASHTAEPHERTPAATSDIAIAIARTGAPELSETHVEIHSPVCADGFPDAVPLRIVKIRPFEKWPMLSDGIRPLCASAVTAPRHQHEQRLTTHSVPLCLRDRGRYAQRWRKFNLNSGTLASASGAGLHGHGPARMRRWDVEVERVCSRGGAPPDPASRDRIIRGEPPPFQMHHFQPRLTDAFPRYSLKPSGERPRRVASASGSARSRLRRHSLRST